MILPIKKEQWFLNSSKIEHLMSYKNHGEIPVDEHPGAFGVKRKNHIHEGVDLYCENGEIIYSMEDGEIVNILPFTGEQVGTSWWNNTWCVMVRGNSGVINYGEIIPNEKIKIGNKIKMGTEIGYVTTILKKNKGRPMNMLHLELYTEKTKEPIKCWDLLSEKPENLLNPTKILLELYRGGDV